MAAAPGAAVGSFHLIAAAFAAAPSLTVHVESRAIPPSGVDLATADTSTVRAAIDAMHAAGTAKEDFTRADRFLQEYSRTQKAWATAEELLAEDPTASVQAYQRVYFGALFMHDKVKTSLSSLAPEVVPLLRDALVGHIERMQAALTVSAAADAASAAAGGTAGAFGAAAAPAGSASSSMSLATSQLSKVLVRLCLAYSALMVQLPDVTSQQVVTAAVQLFPVDKAPLALLEILQLLPEEASRAAMKITKRRREEFMSGLRAMGGEVLDLLANLLTRGGTEGNIPLASKAMRCFGSWVHEVGLAPSRVAASGIVETAFAAMRTNLRLFDDAVATVMDTVESFSSAPRDMPVINQVVAGVLSLGEWFDAATAAEDSDVAGALAGLFAATACNYHDIIVLDMGDAVFEAGKLAFLRLLVAASCHPETPVAMRCTHAWRHLGDKFVNILYHSNPKRREAAVALAAQLAPLLAPVVDVTVARMVLPLDWETMAADAREDFQYTKRYDLADQLGGIHALIGDAAMHAAISERLQAAATAVATDAESHWRDLEAAMYALRCVGTIVKPDDETILTPLLSMFPSLPGKMEMRATAFRVLSRFARWLSAHTDLVSPCVDYCIDNGLLPFPGAPADSVPIPSLIQMTAAAALGHVLGDALPAARDVALAVHTRLPLASLHPTNANKVLEHLARAIALLPAGHHEAALTSLVAPFVTRLQTLATDPAAGLVAAGHDGSLLAACVHTDGYIRQHYVDTLQVPESVLESLLRAALASGGSIAVDPATFPIPVARMTTVLASNLLERLSQCISHCVCSNRSHLAIALGHPPGEQLPRRPKAGQPSMLRSDELALLDGIDAAEESCAEAIVKVLALAWPTLEAVATTFSGAGSDGSFDVHVKLGHLFHNAIRAGSMSSMHSLLPNMINAAVALNRDCGGDEAFLQFMRGLLHCVGAGHPARPTVLEGANNMLEAVFATVRSCPREHPAGFAENLDLVKCACEVAIKLFVQEPDAVLNSTLAETFVEFASAALDCPYNHKLVAGPLPLLYALLSAGRNAADTPSNSGKKKWNPRSDHYESERHNHVGPPFRSATYHGENHPCPAPTPEQLAARRARVLALFEPVIEPLFKRVFRNMLTEWQHSNIYHFNDEQPYDCTISEFLHLLLVHFFPAPAGGVSQLATWALEVFEEPTATREPVARETKMALLRGAFSNSRMELATFMESLTAIFDCARAYVETRREDDLDADEISNGVGAAAAGLSAPVGADDSDVYPDMG